MTLKGLYNFNQNSALGRLFIWQVTGQMIKEKPLTGMGVGKFGVEYLNYQAVYFTQPGNERFFDRAANMKQADNEYLQTWAELGVIGLLIFLATMVSILYTLYNYSFRKNTKVIQHYLVLATAISVLSVLIHSLVDNPIRNLAIQIPFLTSIAISSNILTDSSDKPTRSFITTKPIARIMLTILFLIIAIFNSQSVYLKSKGYTLWQSGIDSASQGNWFKAIEYYEKTSSILKNNSELKFYLGSAYSYMNKPNKSLPLLKSAKLNFNDKNL